MKFTKILFAALFAIAMLATGVQADPTLVPDEEQFFLRGTGCGATEDPYLSTKSGSDELDGCGGIGGVPFNEVFGTVLDDNATLFSARDGLPLILDNSRDIEMVITAEEWVGGPGGYGQSIVVVSLSGTQEGSFASKSLGSATSEQIALASGQTAHSFTFDIPASINTTPFKTLNLEVEVRGANYNHSNLALEGDSHLTLPIFIEQDA